MGPVIQCGPACDVQKEIAQCRWQTVCQVKKAAEKQEEPAKKSQWIEQKHTTERPEVKSPQPVDPSQDSSDSTELLDVLWAPT